MTMRRRAGREMPRHSRHRYQLPARMRRLPSIPPPDTPMTKTILCYGDSNTHGSATVERPDGRYGPDERWPGVLRGALGSGWLVIEEGLGGRTTVSDDPVEGLEKNGKTYLLPCLHTHKPLDRRHHHARHQRPQGALRQIGLGDRPRGRRAGRHRQVGRRRPERRSAGDPRRLAASDPEEAALARQDVRWRL